MDDMSTYLRILMVVSVAFCISLFSNPAAVAQQFDIKKEHVAILTADNLDALDTTLKPYLDRNEFVTAIQLVMFIRNNSDNADVREWCRQKIAMVGDLRRHWRMVQRAQAELKENPDDEQAHLTIGKFELKKQNWDVALESLGRGGDDPLAVLARQTQAAEEPQAKLNVADGWYELIEEYPIAEPKSLTMYQEILPELQGIKRVRVEKLLEGHAEKKQVTVRKNARGIIGTWVRGDGRRFILKPDGALEERNENGNLVGLGGGVGTWKLVDGEIHVRFSSGEEFVWRIENGFLIQPWGQCKKVN